MIYRSILLATPLRPSEPTIDPRCESSIHTAIRGWAGRVDWLKLRSDSADHYSDLLRKLQRARLVALAGGYEALLIVEADMILPPHAISRMAQINAQIVYALYCSRRDGHKWLSALTMTEDTATATWLSDAPGLACAVWGGVMTSVGVGTGCTLIRCEALRDLPFRIVERGMAPDWYLALDAEAKGLRQVTDLGTVCGHALDDGSVVWPDATNASLHRIEHPQRTTPAISPTGRYRVKSGRVEGPNGTSIPVGGVLHLAPDSAQIFLSREIVEPFEED